MLAGRAIMVNWSNVAPQHRPAYYHWHGSEHMVGRLAIPGYRRGRRFAALEASRDFLVLYEVDDLGVVTGKSYLDKANNPSPLTQATTRYVTDAARALAGVRLTLGIGQGGYVCTLRFDARSERAPDLEACVVDALRAAAGLPGIVGAHFCIADDAASRIVPVEREGRPTTIPAWIVLLEAIAPEALRQAAESCFATERLMAQGARGPIERDLYAHQMTVGGAR